MSVTILICGMVNIQPLSDVKQFLHEVERSHMDCAESSTLVTAGYAYKSRIELEYMN